MLPLVSILVMNFIEINKDRVLYTVVTHSHDAARITVTSKNIGRLEKLDLYTRR